MKIITHTSPDWDAIGASWLVQRYLLPDAEIVCVSREEIEKCMNDNDGKYAVLDCGGEYDPVRLRFDHHHLPGARANATCATLQAWFHIGTVAIVIEPIVKLIWAGETGKNAFGAKYSREVGLHALLAARKDAGWTDDALMEWGCQELDLLADKLKRQEEATIELAEKLMWQSDDGKVVAIGDGEQRHNQAAFTAGATLVVFQSKIPTERGVSLAIGIQRNADEEFPHVGDLLAASRLDASTQEDKWFRHPAGFFAGRETGKAPRFDPVPDGLTAEGVARAIDVAWAR